MVLVYVTCINPRDQFLECNYADEDLESCLETLTQLVEAGWQLCTIDYFCAGMPNKVNLPVSAFDGQPIYKPMKDLQRSWESILASA